MNQQITEAEAVEIVEARLGMKPYCMDDSPFSEHPFLLSRDALQPVLEKLTAEEWTSLDKIIAEQWRRAMCVSSFMRFLLTIPARTLCLAVAAAIKESAK